MTLDCVCVFLWCVFIKWVVSVCQSDSRSCVTCHAVPLSDWGSDVAHDWLITKNTMTLTKWDNLPLSRSLSLLSLFYLSLSPLSLSISLSLLCLSLSSLSLPLSLSSLSLSQIFLFFTHSLLSGLLSSAQKPQKQITDTGGAGSKKLYWGQKNYIKRTGRVQGR